MFILKRIWCRIFQTAFRTALPVLPYREPKVIESCSKLNEIFKKENINAVLVVTDKGIVNNGLLKPVEDVLKQSNTGYTVYDGTQPNPTVDNVEEALTLYHKNNCNSLIMSVL